MVTFINYKNCDFIIASLEAAVASFPKRIEMAKSRGLGIDSLKRDYKKACDDLVKAKVLKRMCAIA